MDRAWRRIAILSENRRRHSRIRLFEIVGRYE